MGRGSRGERRDGVEADGCAGGSLGAARDWRPEERVVDGEYDGGERDAQHVRDNGEHSQPELAAAASAGAVPARLPQRREGRARHGLGGARAHRAERVPASGGVCALHRRTSRRARVSVQSVVGRTGSGHSMFGAR